MSKIFTLACLVLCLPAIADDNFVRLITKDVPITKVTQQVYVIHGADELPNRDNQGFINNPAFVLTTAGVVIIDPGGSVQVGQLLLSKIKIVTDKPVIAVFNTHVHGDHWLGNHAIELSYPQAIIYAHENMIAQLKVGEGDRWVKIFDSLTEGQTHGTKVTIPDKALKGGETLSIGNTHFRITSSGGAHTDTDLIIEVLEEEVVFMGDVLVDQFIQAINPNEGNIKTQIETLQLAMQFSAKHFIPGHGRIGDRQLAERYVVYLEQVYSSVKRYFDKGWNDYEMKNNVLQELKAYEHWQNFSQIGRLINAVYLQIELVSF